jgi:hypothetical protein
MGMTDTMGVQPVPRVFPRAARGRPDISALPGRQSGRPASIRW